MSINTRANFLMVVSILFFFYSLLWALAPFSSFNLPARFILDLADWPLNNLAAPLEQNVQFLSAIGAGLLAAISIFLGGIVVPAIKAQNIAIINCCKLAMIIWYVIDGVGSIAAGVASNVVFNTFYLLLVLAPLLCFNKVKFSD